ncbi:Endonuclease/exonuclease/phosphatase, partial [Phascolomyces articulosus]
MKNKTRNKVTPAIIQRRKEAAARAFTVPSATHGFCFKYFPTRGRKPVSEQRKNLKRLGIDNSRILDIHYPDTNVVGFLIHNDYEQELIEIMKKSNLEPNTNFDPHNPNYLKDQKYKDLSDDEKLMQAEVIQYHRILRAIDFIRKPVKFSVARFFCQKQIISPDTLQEDKETENEMIIDYNILDKHDLLNNPKEFINTNILFITETWLLSPNRYPTNWTQYHTYGIPIHSPHKTHRGQMGISLLVHPHCPFPVNHLPNLSPSFQQYSLSCTIGDTLIHCLYLPPTQKFDDHLAIEILDTLPREIEGTSRTIYCGDFNARLGERIGDHSYDSRGRLLTAWLAINGMTVYNETLAYGEATNLNPRGSSIVDLFFGTTPLPNASMKIYDDTSLSSEHKAVQITYTDICPSTNTTNRRMWHLQKLKKPEARENYINTFASKIQPLHQRIIQHIGNKT